MVGTIGSQCMTSARTSRIPCFYLLFWPFFHRDFIDIVNNKIIVNANIIVCKSIKFCIGCIYSSRPLIETEEDKVNIV